jgi:hypothetical protein
MSASLVSFSQGCGTGGAAGIVRPSLPSATEALNDPTRDHAFLVVDMPAAERADLERALKDSHPILVAYNGKTPHIVHCTQSRVMYRYEPFQRKNDAVALSSTDAVRSHLKFGGASVALELEGEFARGRQLELALTTSGRYVYPARRLHRADVSDCQSATHFVASATIGAFSMRVGAHGHVNGAVNALVTHSRGASESTKTHLTSDGNRDACMYTPRPQEQCASPIELIVKPIEIRTKAQADCEDDGSDTACIDWSRASKKESPEFMTALARLEALCTSGKSTITCVEASAIYIRGGHRDRTTEQRIAVFGRACRTTNVSGDGGDRALACLALADIHTNRSEFLEALSSRLTACERHPVYCQTLADDIEENPTTYPPEVYRKTAMNLRADGCLNGGYACGKLHGAMLAFPTVAHFAFDNESRKNSVSRIVDNCERGTGDCRIATFLLHFGIAIPRDVKRAQRTWLEWCAKNTCEKATAEQQGFKLWGP